MIRTGDRARVMEVRELRTVAGPARMFLHADFDADGALRQLGWSPPPPDRVTEADRAAARMLDKVGGALRNGVSIEALIQRGDLMLDLLHALRAIEDRHGRRARELLAERAA